METAVLIGGDGRARLEAKDGSAARRGTAFDDLNIVAREGGIDVAADDRRLPGDVAAACRALEQDLIVVPLRMHQRRARRQASAMVMTAGRGSISTAIAAAAAWACANVSAAIAATGSPS